MENKLSRFALSDYLTSSSDVETYLQTAAEMAFEENDFEILKNAIGDVMKLKGVGQISHATNLPKATLYKAFGASGNPRFDTLMKVLNALNIQIDIRLAQKAA